MRPTSSLEVASDSKDNPFLECADAGEADSLVTGNPRHFPVKWGKTRVVRARQLVELLAPKESR